MSYENEAAEILAIAKNLRGKVDNIDDLAHVAINAGNSADQFRAAALRKLPAITPMAKPLCGDVPVKDWANYSLSRAIGGLCNGKLDGFEREVSDETSRQVGRGASGFWLPPQALQRNFVAGTGTLGGMVVETSNLGSEFIELARNKAMVAQLGARILNLNSPATIPRQAAAGVANWLGESVAATLSTGNFEQVTLQPYAISSYQQYSKQLLVTSNPGIDALIQNDINQIIALAVDRAALHGTGSGQPTGIANTTGIGTVSVAMLAASALSTSLFPFLVSLETSVATNNLDGGALAYLVNPKTRAACKTLPKLSSNELAIYDGGKINGYRAETTNQIATNLTTGTATTICTAAFFGDWSQLLIAQFNGGASDLTVDPYSLAANGVVRIIARRWVDIGLRHPGAFAVGGGIIA